MRRHVVTMNQSMLTPTSQCSSATYQTDPRRRSIAPNTSPAGPAAQASFSALPKCAVTDSAVCTRLDDVSPITPRSPKRSTPRNSTSQEPKRSEEHTSELQSPCNLVCRVLLEKKKTSELQSPCNLVCRLLLETKKHASIAARCSSS